MTDADHMRRAIALAWKSAGHTRPNPPVGAVIVKDGILLGSGFHARAGGPHAEAAAIEDALKNGVDLSGVAHLEKTTSLLIK